MTICIFCASSPKVAPCYFEAAAQLSKTLVKEGHTILFGGGSKGLMGIIADTALAENGTVIGIIPHFMKEVEWDHPGVSEMILVASMAERKKLLLEKADAVVALPGGCGTLEELSEAISAKRLGLFTKPIVIFNQNGFYDPLLEMLDTMVKEHFMRMDHMQIWSVVQAVDEVLPAIEQAPVWDSSAIHFAAV